MAQAMVKLHDKVFELYLSEKQIRERVKEMAAEISEDFSGSDPVFVSILNGSFLFSADLLRSLSFQCEIEFVKLASYVGTASTGQVETLFGFNKSVEDRPIIILEDIVDTGRTINKLKTDIQLYNPANVHVASFLFKREALLEPVDLDYTGFEIPNFFVVGYGLDYDQLGRNLKSIYKLKSE